MIVEHGNDMRKTLKSLFQSLDRDVSIQAVFTDVVLEVCHLLVPEC